MAAQLRCSVSPTAPPRAAPRLAAGGPRRAWPSSSRGGLPPLLQAARRPGTATRGGGAARAATSSTDRDANKAVGTKPKVRSRSDNDAPRGDATAAAAARGSCGASLRQFRGRWRCAPPRGPAAPVFAAERRALTRAPASASRRRQAVAQLLNRSPFAPAFVRSIAAGISGGLAFEAVHSATVARALPAHSLGRSPPTYAVADGALARRWRRCWAASASRACCRHCPPRARPFSRSGALGFA